MNGAKLVLSDAERGLLRELVNFDLHAFTGWTSGYTYQVDDEDEPEDIARFEERRQLLEALQGKLVAKVDEDQKLDLDDDARSAVLWALENGEAALRTEKNSWPEPATSNLRHLKRGAESVRQALYHGPKIEEVSNDRP